MDFEATLSDDCINGIGQGYAPRLDQRSSIENISSQRELQWPRARMRQHLHIEHCGLSRDEDGADMSGLQLTTNCHRLSKHVALSMDGDVWSLAFFEFWSLAFFENNLWMFGLSKGMESKSLP